MLKSYRFQGGTRLDAQPPDVLLTPPDLQPLEGTGRVWYRVLTGSRDAIFVWYGGEQSIADWHSVVQGLFGALTYTGDTVRRERLGRFEFVRQELIVTGLGRRSTALLSLSDGRSFYFTTTNEAAIPDLVRVLETFDIRG